MSMFENNIVDRREDVMVLKVYRSNFLGVLSVNKKRKKISYNKYSIAGRTLSMNTTIKHTCSVALPFFTGSILF